MDALTNLEHDTLNNVNLYTDYAQWWQCWLATTDELEDRNEFQLVDFMRWLHAVRVRPTIIIRKYSQELELSLELLLRLEFVSDRFFRDNINKKLKFDGYFRHNQLPMLLSVRGDVLQYEVFENSGPVVYEILGEQPVSMLDKVWQRWHILGTNVHKYLWSMVE